MCVNIAGSDEKLKLRTTGARSHWVSHTFDSICLDDECCMSNENMQEKGLNDMSKSESYFNLKVLRTLKKFW